MLGVVGPCQVCKWATYICQTTRDISQAQLVRSAVLNSVDPIDMLFDELPEAVATDQNEKERILCVGILQRLCSAVES